MKTLFFIFSFIILSATVKSQTIHSQFKEDFESYKAVPIKYIKNSDGTMSFIGKAIYSSGDSVAYFQTKLEKASGKYQFNSKSIFKEKLNNLLGYDSEYWADENGNTYLISLLALGGKVKNNNFKTVYPKYYCWDKNGAIISEKIDTNNFQVVANGSSPKITRVNKDSLCVPTFGSDRFGENFGLYLTYYNNECKALGYKYIKDLDSTDFKQIDSLVYILDFHPKINTCEFGEYILSGDLTYSTGTLGSKCGVYYGYGIVKYSKENLPQWSIINADLSKDGKTQIYNCQKIANRIALFANTNLNENSYGDSKIYFANESTGKITDSLIFGKDKSIRINKIKSLDGGEFMLVGSYDNYKEYLTIKSRKYYAARLDANFKIKWEIFADKDSKDLSEFMDCVEDGNEALLFGCSGDAFLGVVIDNSKSEVIDIKPNGESSIKINTENHKIKLTNKGENSNIQCVLTDMLGGVVLKKNIELLGGAEYEIEETNISAGAYILQVEANGIMISKKIII
jgi:hypothetical protein